MKIASVHYTKVNGEFRIYLADTKRDFSTTEYGGFIRNISSERTGTVGFEFLKTYKVVLFLDKDMCDEDAERYILNIETERTLDKNIKYVRIKRHFLDSYENIKKEVKDNIYADYKVVVIEIEVKENICKKLIKCN